jgi:hypothetical protein
MSVPPLGPTPLPPLTPDQLQVLKVAQHIVKEGLTVAQACLKEGIKRAWSDRTFGINVKNLMNNPVTRSVLGQAGRETLRTAVRTIGGDALAAAGSSLSFLAGLPGLILLAVILAGLGAGWYWANHMGDKPVKPGVAMSGTHPGRGPNAWAPAPIGQHDKYYIYAVNTSGWSLFVGRPSDVEGRPAGTLTDGGEGDTPVEYKKLVGTAFDNSDAALAYVKAHISPGHESRWTGTWVKFEGGEYRTVHLGL